MSKRILSICLALAVMLVALPILPISMAGTQADALAPGEVNPVFTPSQLPDKAVDRVIATFDEADAEVGHINYWREWPAEGGYKDYYMPQYKGYISTGGSGWVTNQTIENGGYKIEYDTIGTGEMPAVYVFTDSANPKHTPSVNTTALQFHIDTTHMSVEGVGKSMAFRFTLNASEGTSGAKSWFYILDNKTWYFTPDATNENPNPETQVMTTRNATSIYNCYLDVPTGVSGTVTIPIDAFLFDENSKITNISSLTSKTGDKAAWDTFVANHEKDTWRHQSSVGMQLRTYSMLPGDYYVLDSFQWLMDTPFDYQLQTVTQDFSNFTPKNNWQWIYGNVYLYTNNPGNAFNSDGISVVDGRYCITPNDTVTDTTSYHNTINQVGQWKENYKAISFDLDVSGLTGSHYSRIYFYGRYKTETGAAGSSTNFRTYGGTIYFVADDGTVTAYTNSSTSKTDPFWTVPEGFKGKVIIPVDVVHNTSNDGHSLHEAYDEFGAYFEFRDWGASNYGQSLYIDNYTYYASVEGPEAGYNFATDKIGYESNGVISDTISTVEAWVNTSATTAGTILADKFTYGSKNYADGFESIVLGMNAAGNPTVYISTGNHDGVFCDWTISDVTINNGKWNHVAVTIDNGIVKFYLNGMEVATKECAGMTTVEMARPITLGHTITNSVGVSNWFDGQIAKVAIFGDVRTAGEIMSDALGSIDTTDENLLANWDLAGSVDNTLKAYDLKVTAEDEKYNTYVNEIKDGSYTIAFLPDTQIINRDYADDKSEFDYFNNMYTWIIDKADDYNIKGVMSLGDITDLNAEYEWENARAAFDRLSAAGIPWTAVQGNHDYESLGGRNTILFQQYFPSTVYDNATWDESTFKLGGMFYIDEYGYLPEEKAELSSAYYYLNVDADADYEYLLLTLEFEAGTGTLEWARQVVEKNADKKVIITTHGYMDANGTRTTHSTDGNKLYHDALNYTAGASGEDLWNYLVSQYANIEMILCGHLSCPDIITRVDKGVHGNNVLQVLMDSQGLDASPENPVAMVGLATFNADGTMVSFKYVSTRDYRTETAAGDYFYDDNSNELKFNLGATTGTYVDKSVDNSVKIEAQGLFAAGVVVRDFSGTFTTGTQWWANSKQVFTIGGCTDKIDVTANYDKVPFKWESGRIKRQATNEGTTGYFQKLPNFTPINGEIVKAVSIHLENASTETQYFRISMSVPYADGFLGSNTIEFRNYDNNYKFSHKIYLVADDGTVTETGNSTWAVGIPANFSGTMILPLDNNFCQWGQASGNNIYTAEDFATDVEGNEVYLAFNSQGASCTRGAVYFDNIAYHTTLDGAYVSTVKDKNGEIIDFVEIKQNETVDESTLPAAPEKYGMEFIGWANVAVPGGDIYPLYEKIAENKYTITATNGTVYYPAGQDYALYNDRVVAQAPAVDAEGNAFSYWTANGSIFSYEARVSFLAFGDAEMVAVYGAEVDNKIVVFTDSQATITANGSGKYNMQVMGGVYVPEDVTVKEIGILLTNIDADAETIIANYEAGAANVVKLVAAHAEANKQFTYGIKNISAGQTRTALTYAVLSDGTMVYGDVSCVAVFPANAQ